MAKVIQPRYDTDPKVLARQVVVETYRSRGPGGQRKNKTETAVRLRHLPTGITVVATEYRSQAQNRKLAFQRLKERILRLNRPRKRRIPTSIPLGAIERRKEDKRAHSIRKQRRHKAQKDLNGWE